MHCRARIVTFASLLLMPTVLPAIEISFPTPSDDRWFYPFNFTPASRAIASCFGAAGETGFNDRDAEIILAWNTSTAITPGLGVEAYGVRSVRVTLTNKKDAAWPIDTSLDEWFTFDLNQDTSVNADGIPRGQPGDTDGESSDADPGRPLELFGAGFGPFFTLANWTEASLYVGSGGDGDFPRDPFPFVFGDSPQTLLHVEDNVKGLHNDALVPPVFSFTPVPWAIGMPLNYTPGSQSVPFDVRFDVNLSLSQGQVSRYFREQLNAGRVVIIVTSLQAATIQGPQSGFPSFFQKEGLGLDPGAKAPRLDLAACLAVMPDFDRDCDVDADDLAHFESCATGAASGPPAQGCSDADLDQDHDVDQADFGVLQRCLSGSGNDPPPGCDQ